MAIVDGNLNDVVVFAQVVEVGSFTAAARSLGLPTSSVSRRVARLEERLGVRLLQRTTRRLSLTDAGRSYYESAAQAIAELGNAERALSAAQQTPRGSVRMSAPAELDAITQVIAGFLHDFPDVHVELDLDNRKVDLIAEGFDLALRAGDLADSSLIAHKLLASRRAMVASPGYVQRRGTPTRIEDLRDHDCVVFGPMSTQSAWMLRDKRKLVRVPVRGRISVNQIGAAREAAIAGLGIALIPAGFCATDLCAGRLVRLLPDACPEDGALSLVYPSRKHLMPAVRVLIERIKDELPQQLTEYLRTGQCADSD